MNGVLFNFDFQLDRRVRLMYYNVYEPEVVAFMRRTLRKGDTFLDIGANIGYLTAVAMGLVGHEGSIHAFEPAPEYFSRLRQLAGDNPSYRVYPYQIALGETSGDSTLLVSETGNIGWNTLVPGYMKERKAHAVPVTVVRGDDFLGRAAVDTLSLVKIDTEGYELPVLTGLHNDFLWKGYRPPLIVELSPEAYPLLGRSVTELQNWMDLLGYRAYLPLDSGRLGPEVNFDGPLKAGNVLLIPRAGGAR